MKRIDRNLLRRIAVTVAFLMAWPSGPAAFAALPVLNRQPATPDSGVTLLEAARLELLADMQAEMGPDLGLSDTVERIIAQYRPGHPVPIVLDGDLYGAEGGFGADLPVTLMRLQELVLERLNAENADDRVSPRFRAVLSYPALTTAEAKARFAALDAGIAGRAAVFVGGPVANAQASPWWTVPVEVVGGGRQHMNPVYRHVPVPERALAPLRRFGFETVGVRVARYDRQTGALAAPKSLTENPFAGNPLAEIGVAVSVGAALAAANFPGRAGSGPNQFGEKGQMGAHADGAAVALWKEMLEKLAKAYNITIIVGGNEGKIRDAAPALEVGQTFNAGATGGTYLFFGDAIEVTNGVKEGKSGSNSMAMLVPVDAVSFVPDLYDVAVAAPISADTVHGDVDPVIAGENTLEKALLPLAQAEGITVEQLKERYDVMILERGTEAKPGRHLDLTRQAKTLGFEVHAPKDGDAVPMILRASAGVRGKNGKKLIVLGAGGANEHAMARVAAALTHAFHVGTMASNEGLQGVDNLSSAHAWSEAETGEFDSLMWEGRKLREQLLRDDIPLIINAAGETPDQIVSAKDMEAKLKSGCAIAVSMITGSREVDAGVLQPWLGPVEFRESPNGNGEAVVRGFTMGTDGELYVYEVVLKSEDLVRSRWDLLAANRQFEPMPVIRKFEDAHEAYEDGKVYEVALAYGRHLLDEMDGQSAERSALDTAVKAADQDEEAMPLLRLAIARAEQAIIRRILGVPAVTNEHNQTTSVAAPGRETAAREWIAIFQTLKPELYRVFLQYSVTAGAMLEDGEGRRVSLVADAVARFLAPQAGIPATVEQVLPTNGPHESRVNALELLLNAGDKVIVARGAFAERDAALGLHGVEGLPISMDREGLEALDRALEQGQAAYAGVRCVWVNTASLEPELRPMLIELANRRNLMIIEDDSTRGREGAVDAHAPLKAYDTVGRVIYIGSAESVVPVGAQFGYLIADPMLTDKAINLKGGANLMVSGSAQLAMLTLIEAGMVQFPQAAAAAAPQGQTPPDLSAFYSTVAAAIQEPIVRQALGKIRPGMISFAGGLPSPELLPVEEVRSVFAADDPQALADEFRPFLEDDSPLGIQEVRQAMADMLTSGDLARGMTADPNTGWERVGITDGSQEALSLLVKALNARGKLIVGQDPTYAGAVSAFENYGAKVGKTFDFMTREGLDAFEAFLMELGPDGIRDQLGFVYVMSNFSNPSGQSLPVESRRRLYDLAQRHGFYLVEDDPYYDMSYYKDTAPNRAAHRPIKAIEDEERRKAGKGFQERVIYLDSCSKKIAPGLRIGIAYGPEEVIQRLGEVKEIQSGAPSGISQFIILKLLRSGKLIGHLKRARDTYSKRRDAMRKELEAMKAGRLAEKLAANGFSPPEIEGMVNALAFTDPDGGFFFRLTLSEGFDTMRMFNEIAVADPDATQCVAFIPGAPFLMGSHELRLNFTLSTVEEIERGMRLLEDVIVKAALAGKAGSVGMSEAGSGVATPPAENVQPRAILIGTEASMNTLGRRAPGPRQTRAIVPASRAEGAAALNSPKVIAAAVNAAASTSDDLDVTPIAADQRWAAGRVEQMIADLTGTGGSV